jgi:DNA-binding MarR family transcriptional regulator
MEARTQDEAMQAWRALLTAQAVVLDAVEGQLQGVGQMPLAWFEVLVRLADEPQGALRMQDLAERLVLSRSGVTRLVDRLEAAGLIERASCPSDRRGTYAVLTESGRRALETGQPLVERAVEEHFGRHLEQAEAELLESTLGKLLAAHGYARQSDRGEGPQEAEPAEQRRELV